MHSNEQALVAACINEESALLSAVDYGVKSEWFDSDECRSIWTWCYSALGESRPIDLISFGAVCHGKVLPAYPKWLDEAYERSVSSHASYYAGQVRQEWLKRVVLSELDIMQIAAPGSEDIEDYILNTANKLRLIVDSTQQTNKGLKAIAGELLTEWGTPDRRIGLPWPVSGLNDGIGPITDELVFVAAKESLGKTAFALQWAISLAWGGHIVSIRTLESATKKLVQRIISNVGQVNTWKLRTKQGGAEDKRKAVLAVERIGEIENRIRICSAPANMEKLKAWAMMEKQKGSEFLIIDNMKHIRPSQKYSSPVEQFRDISQQLKWMRDDVGLPVLVLHHTNEQGDVSWSSDIRRDVDILIVMEADEQNSVAPGPHNGWVGKRIVRFDVRKDRDGASGFAVTQIFRGDVQTFEDEVVRKLGVESDI